VSDRTKKAVHFLVILDCGEGFVWQPIGMTRTTKRARRLWDAYCFPGFRPEPTVCGVSGDPKARL